jgi:V/A-type H+-transporting ATPase subunit E
MAMDVATFAKQLKEDGIDAARVEAEKILSDARAKAEALKKEGEAAAQKRLQNIEEEAIKFRQKAEAELRLVARDLLIDVKRQIEKTMGILLKDKIAGALALDEVVKSAILELLKTQKSGKEWELALGPTIGKSLAAAAVTELFKTAGAQAKLVEGFKGAGFELKAKGGTEVIEVSDDSVASAFRLLLSPELIKLLDTKK